jgi:hypothetical protein
VKTNIVLNDNIILDWILFRYICCELIVCVGYTCMSENLMHIKKKNNIIKNNKEIEEFI